MPFRSAAIEKVKPGEMPIRTIHNRRQKPQDMLVGLA